MTSLEVLKAAYHLLDDKARWTTCALARDKHGRGINAESPRAVQWCALGALLWANNGRWDADAARELTKAVGRGVATTNNGPDGYELIREAFRKAIADLEPPVKRAPRKKELVAV